jgi:rubrerythrin
MRQLKGSRTEQNLRAALEREAQDNRRFEYFARYAAVEGHVAVARDFRQIAEGETAHAFGHLEFLEAVDDPLTGGAFDGVRTHLEVAIAAEEGRSELYPTFAAVARDERLPEVAEWFDLLARAKRRHVARLARALDELEGFQ